MFGLCCLGEAPPQCFCGFKLNEEMELCLAVASVLSDVSLSSIKVSGSSWGGPALAPPPKWTLSDTLGASASTGAPSWPPSTWQTHTHTHSEHFSWADMEMNVITIPSELVRVSFLTIKAEIWLENQLKMPQHWILFQAHLLQCLLVFLGCECIFCSLSIENIFKSVFLKCFLQTAETNWARSNSWTRVLRGAVSWWCLKSPDSIMKTSIFNLPDSGVSGLICLCQLVWWG